MGAGVLGLSLPKNLILHDSPALTFLAASACLAQWAGRECELFDYVNTFSNTLIRTYTPEAARTGESAAVRGIPAASDA